MSNTKNEEIGSLKIGSYIIMGGDPSKITKMDRSAPGKHGHAKYRVEAVGLLSKQKRVQVITGHAKVEVPIIEKRNAQVLSVSGDNAQLMDLETYENFEAAIDDEVKGKVKEGEQVLYWDVLGTRVVKQVK